MLNETVYKSPVRNNQIPWSSAVCISIYYRIIVTVRKHIAGNCFAGISANVSIRVNKPPVCGVVVAGLEVVEAGFVVVVVATIAEWVFIRHGAGLREDIAPCVVFVGCYGTTGGSDQLYNVTLETCNLQIGREAPEMPLTGNFPPGGVTMPKSNACA